MKVILITAAVGLLTLGASTASFANNTIAAASVVSPSTTDYTFTGGVGGTLTSAFDVSGVGPSSTSFTDALFTLSPLTETGVATPVAGGYDAAFSNGSFTLVANNGTGATLLSGTFTGSLLFGTTPSNPGVYNASFNDVTYTGGTLVPAYTSEYGGNPPLVGDFNLAMTGATPGFGPGGAGGGLAAFSAEGSTISFDATPTPETSSVVTVSMGVLALVGLMVVARRRTGLQY